MAPTGPTGSAPTTSGSVPTWLWPAACLVLLAGLVVAAMMALSSGDNGNRWKHRAETAEQQATDLRGKLEKSQKDATGLEKRTVTLADEKAHAEDDAAIHATLGDAGQNLAKALDDCSSTTMQVLAVMATAENSAQLQSLQPTINRLMLYCSEVQGASDRLSEYLREQH